MKKLKYSILMLLLTVLTSMLHAQDGKYITVRDFETWSGMELKYKANKKWKLGLQQQLRLKNNSTELDAYFTEFSTVYEFSKHTYGGVGVRFIRKNDNVGDNQGTENHLRMQIDLGAKHKAGRFKFDYRLRFQTRNELGITVAQGDNLRNHLRLKVATLYNFKKWKLDPELSIEVFSLFQEGEQTGFDKARFTTGTKYNLKKYGAIGVFYRLERDLIVAYPQTTHIVGLKYGYTIN